MALGMGMGYDNATTIADRIYFTSGVRSEQKKRHTSVPKIVQ